jgi:hypothetical protein
MFIYFLTANVCQWVLKWQLAATGYVWLGASADNLLVSVEQNVSAHAHCCDLVNLDYAYCLDLNIAR